MGGGPGASGLGQRSLAFSSPGVKTTTGDGPQKEAGFLQRISFGFQRRPSGSRERRDRIFVNHFWQLKDVAGEFWMNDAAIMQQTQLAEFLWLVTLHSRKRGSHRLGSD